MKDIIAAACVGITQISIGHPFDTTKVLIQNNKKWFGLPLRNYYRGWQFPLTSAIIFNCTVFPTYERSIKYTNSSFLSGVFSGVLVSPLVFFFDTFKIKKQTNQPISLSMFRNSRGFASTFTRETMAMSAYFGSYFKLRDMEFSPLTAGGAAGLVNWSLTYPIDVIRSRQIAQQISIKEAIKIGTLWKGFSVCASRAIIVNAANFWVYEKVKNLI